MSNIYLLEYENGFLMLDCGIRNDIGNIEAYFRTIGRSPADIKLAVVTHLHPDHAGGAVVLRKKYGIPLAASPNIDRWYAGLGGAIQHKIDCYLTRSALVHTGKCEKGVFFSRMVRPDFYLQDEMTLPYYEDWRVLLIAGHTTHDVALYHEQEKMLYPADYICQVKGKYLLPVPILFPEKAEKSLQRLAEYDAKTIILAHGDPISTDNSSAIFQHMCSQLLAPQPEWATSVNRMFRFSSEIRKAR